MNFNVAATAEMKEITLTELLPFRIPPGVLTSFSFNAVGILLETQLNEPQSTSSGFGGDL